MKRAGVYLRISDDRGGQRLGVTRQREDCTALADRLGWEVVEVYEDNDVSAYSGRRRPSYERLLDDVRGGRVDGVIAWHTDRLHRNTREQLDYIDLSNELGLTTHTVSSGPLDLSTPAGRATAVTLGAWARYESEQKAERQRRAGLQAAEAGRPTGGPRPFGYTAGGLELEQDEAVALQRGYADLLGGVALREIARGWSSAGLTTTRGGAWSATQVRAVLTRARNAGLRTYQGQVIGEAQWPAIVTEETWRAALSLLSDPSRKTSPGYGRRYLLSSIALCGGDDCGQTVNSAGTQHVRSDGSRRIYYRCRTRQHVARDVEPVDELVTEVVLGRLGRPDARGLLAPADPGPDEAALRDEVAAMRVQLDDAAVMFSDGAITGGQFRTVSARLKARLEAAQASQVAAARAPILGDLIDADDPRVVWDELSLARRRSVVDTLMVVTILPEVTRGARVFNPELIRIDWRTA